MINLAGREAAALALMAFVATGCDGAERAPAHATPSGACRWVTEEEMALATGLPAVEAVERVGGCSYLYDTNAFGSQAVRATARDVERPSSIDVYFYPNGDTQAVEVIENGIAADGAEPVRGLGRGGAWSGGNDELWVRTAGGGVRVVVDASELLPGDDLEAIAVKAFTFAEPRLPG
ncbi:hypothetical protein Ade02nite_79280 [Paractinoplanes deccanensis]|uniref:DUF3558 domain-containing protein n=1 Tax=Paractinoplanes deccanensis TaxID=113561 RepID=A0ABQ3YH29_9ACTN|nr:hypothetical protein [Actinoplanes deccanensis]GID79287.1 hypothetical protein Ade02nite_79280 [Actinoplanes deccanensis]